MKKLLLILSGIFLSTGVFAQANPKTETPFVQGEVMVLLQHNHNIFHLVKDLSDKVQLKDQKILSDDMHIWLITFDPNTASNQYVLELMRTLPYVKLAQNNHFVEERATLPNDTNIGNQWHHVNNGGGGGTADADIDSDLAWDITTGGLTTQGDTIVVCIVEGGGAVYSHPDIAANFWRNHNEIPNNSIDDDGNGYVDDYEGWNVNGNNDNHATGNHGTQCMGMAGAVGNNNLGASGANWNVKLMLVSGFSTSESSVIAAYDYPLTMRKMYNNTAGAEGAYVVATSASWGIDNADPTNYPLWCAMYDTLGKYGVLNAGATTNNTVDVDAVGDMPTACASPYMISVTRTGNTDNQAGGYGLTTIDFGAPGINVYTTSGTNSYGTTTGTSFSCPLTAGVIGLLYSVPCNSLITLSKTNPQQAADQVRLALMNGVDPTASMANKSVTGGRLNAFNSVNEILNNCAASNCIAPFTLNTSGLTDTEATLTWNFSGSPVDFSLHFREQGATVWDSVVVSASGVFIDTLQACTTYEFEVMSNCGFGDYSDWSATFSFTTDGCCENPTGLTANVSGTSVDISWNSVLAATSYNVQYKPLSSSTWTSMNNVSSPLSLNGLDSCTLYEIQIQTVCASGSIPFSSSLQFQTQGCGACIDLGHCAASGASTTNAYISNVTVGTVNQNSGDDNGYAIYTNAGSLYRGQQNAISITSTLNGTQFLYVKVFVDLNQNGSFTDSGEELLAVNFAGATTTGNLTIPGTASLGATRMRVISKVLSFSDFAAPGACDNPMAEGEVEDYCVEIENASSVGSLYQNNLFKVYPNPAQDFITLSFAAPGEQQNIAIVNALGQTVISAPVQNKNMVFNTAALAPGIYSIQLFDRNGIQQQSKLIIQ
jgi:hypothetical protein